MALRNWKDIAELIGIAAIIASLLFVGLQLQQEHEIAIVDTHGSLSEERNELSILIGENMSVWSRGLEGEELNSDERGLFIGLLAAVEMHHQRKFIRAREIGPGTPEVQARRFAYALYVFPGMRRTYESEIEFVNAMDAATGDGMSIRPWKSSVLEALNDLDSTQPPVPATKSYIFWSM